MSCSPKVQNFKMFAGNDLRVICTVYDQSGQLVDISNAQSITWELARNVNGSPVITKDLTNGIIISNPTTFTFLIDSAESAALTGVYYHEAEVIASTGYTYTTLSGRLSVRPTLI